MKGKRSAVFIIGLMLSMFLISVVSAQTANTDIVNTVGIVINTVVESIEPFAKQILGSSVDIGDFSAGEILFAKILFLIILISIVWMALAQVDFFSGQTWIHWIVTLAVSILSIRFIGNTLVPSILLPYTTLGVVISAALPFVIYFFVVEIGMKGNQYKTFRKIAWIFFAVVFVVLWATRSDSLGNVKGIYPITALVSIGVLLMDGTIQRILSKMKLERNLSVSDHLRYTKLRKELDELEEGRIQAIKDGNDTQVKVYDKQIKTRKGELTKLSK